ncbi:MAG: response regulator [Bacteroidetes bacterium]|nr:response regulator [Bacteroidota bacterium]
MIESTQCLLVDDDKDDQDIFLICIKKTGKNINCKILDSGVEAISYLLSKIEYTPNLFFWMNMPKMNGIASLKELKKLSGWRKQKYLCIWTTSGGSTSTEALELGANDFIIKPVKTAELVNKLNQIFTTA